MKKPRPIEFLRTALSRNAVTIDIEGWNVRLRDIMTGESVELGTVPIREPDAPNELIPREQLEGMYERPAYRYDFYNECGFWVIIGPMGVERFIFLTSLDEVEGPYDLTDYGVRWGLFPREVDPETVNWEDT